MKAGFKFFLLSFFLYSLNVAGQKVEQDLPDFKEVKVFHALDVLLVPSEFNKIEITGHGKENVEYEVTEGRLEIKLSLEHIFSEDNTLVKIYANNVQVLDANENSVIQVTEKLEGKQLIFRAQEGALITVAVMAEEVKNKAITGGRIEISGMAQKQEVEVHTTGKYYGVELETRNTDVSVTAGGRAEVFVTEYCRATAKLGGVIKIFGNPEVIDKKTSLGGKIL